MTNVKQAIVAMLKNSADGTAVSHPKVARGAVVPAIKVASASQVPDAPKVSTPLIGSTGQDSNSMLEDVSRDVSDRRIAHIVTGAYSGSS